ncbi:MAG: hypothetical protein H6576_15230 [Lewinellaceae bacterium]|nr:hypothetical protein [Saprospiraceae bacterium]MCB9345049.1 hypothetical protein [Lewinellaceae bacterium]
MRTYRLWIAFLLAFVALGVSARNNPDARKAVKSARAQYRDVCANSESQIDQEINNVRARLLGGGDCWWDFTDGRYIVPKVDVSTGQQEVSSIFAGSVWLGGIDPAGNLKLACQDYRSGSNNEFWPGPLTEVGVTESFTCNNWDRHFRVTGEEIRKHLSNLSKGNLAESEIPRGLRGWPATGNPYFVDVWGFDLPFTEQKLAGFFDKDDDGLYDPLKGDYPSIEIRGCPLDKYPDEMIFWIYNDQGGGQPHGNTNGNAIQMEVQVQAFGYQTTDELNDMTFQRYKLINRATERIDSTFFAMWVDPDLGCALDDYIGCDTAKNLMYVYNQDAVDGQPGATCDGVPTYGDKVPILGVDYFRGPLDSNAMEIGMSSFVYYNNNINGPPPGTTDPSAPGEFYNYLTGTWKDGTPYTYGGSGYQDGNIPIRYVFTEPPNDINGWSMCTANLPFGDRRTLQASGPFSLLPGAVNELIIGVPWVPDIAYPCPDMEGLFRADKLAQGLFDNCFDILDGPDAPDADWVEMDREIVVVLTNNPDKDINNNAGENYSERDILAPDTLLNNPDPAIQELISYKFEGYKIYQLIDPNVSSADYENPERSRLVYQVDVKNGVEKIYNWVEEVNPSDPAKKLYFPEVRAEGQDLGVRHTFSIKEDRFATGNDKRLINHKKYYYVVIAYGYNNYGTFDPFTAAGQQRPYIASRLNVQTRTAIPRPIVDVALNSAYGDGVQVIRYEGAGVGGNFLDVEDAMRDQMIQPGFDSVITYKSGLGPLNVTIFNPFEVEDGDYELEFVDSNNSDEVLDVDARWNLRKLPDGQIIASEKSIEKLNEQIIAEYGFSVSIVQTNSPGAKEDEANGGIGAEIEYQNPDQPWIQGIPDQGENVLNYVKTSPLEPDADLDPYQGLSTLGDGFFVPYALCDWRSAFALTPNFYITPAWTDKLSFNGSAMGGAAGQLKMLEALPNVDIVFTSDKSKWSRCAILESASYAYTSTSPSNYPKFPGFETEGNPATPTKTRNSFDVRFSPSVGKEDADNDGYPDPDGAVEPATITQPNGKVINNTKAGQPLYGMGWFPGYAVDVETGRRLNIFFGENSCYSKAQDPSYTGRDMMWNPSGVVYRSGYEPGPTNPVNYYDLLLGGQHWVYVTNMTYDSCGYIHSRCSPEVNAATTAKFPAIKTIAWAGMMVGNELFPLRSYNDGLIPRNNDAVVKLRVDQPYQTWYNDSDGTKNGHPRYGFKIEGRGRAALSEVEIENALDSVKVVPNPYYGFSDYETSQFSQTVKVTNLPGKCKVTIYSLDGKFIRQYNRNEEYMPYNQIVPDVEWDLKNSKGIPVASGVYLIHIDAPGMGERTVKWFGIARQFDPTGL